MTQPITANLTGDTYRELVAAGTRCVEQHVDAINALNVFPVPDGDTGINMLLTMRSADDSPELPPAGTGTVGEVSHALARGALLGARGNSGVIFSQFMKGLSQALEDCVGCDGEHLAAALVQASVASYQAVGKPVEGTMLTVMRAAAEAVDSSTAPPADVLRTALEAAERALEHTPEQLPILKEAGVVDAGGQGVVAFLAGALGYLDGVPPTLEIASPAEGTSDMPGDVSHEFLEHTEEEMYGYCTQFIIQGQGLDVDAVREQVEPMARSTVVVGDDRTVRVHAHAEDPGPLLSMGVAHGSIDQISIQDMDLQHQQFMARHGYTGEERQAFAVVAVAPGDGLARVFADQGAAQVVLGGQTMNPSAAELLEAIKRANGRHTVLLPNNANIVMAANQAAELAETSVSVVPSRNVPQGIAALLAFNPELDDAANVAAMRSALAGVQAGEVTTAIRSTTINGVAVADGEAIGLLDGEVVSAEATPSAALMALIERSQPEDGSLVTLYYGADVDEQTAQADADTIASRFDGVETEIVSGGQPHYHFLVSIE
jgi:DAK2 domain fusion protein YloV